MAVVERDQTLPWLPISAWLRQWGPALILLLVVVSGWEFVVRQFNIGIFLLPAPSVIADRLISRSGFLLSIGWYTLREALSGYAIGCTLGLCVALISVRWRWIATGLMPLAVASNAIPIIALAPLAGVWFGSTTSGSKIAIVALMTFFPTLINAYRGLISPTPAALALLNSYAASPRQIFLKLRVPAALPYIFTALRLGTTLSMIGAVVSEFFGGPLNSLGVYISSQSGIGHYAESWAAIIVACGLGLAFYLVIALIERFVVPWQR